MIEAIAFVTTAVILSFVPAYILYTKLPAETSVKGPFKGLTVQLKGAFAGFFITLVLLSSLLFTYRKTAPEAYEATEAPEYELYTVTGTLESDDFSKTELQNFRLLIEPPRQRILPDGTFFLENVPVSSDPTGLTPTLIVVKEHQEYFDQNTIHLKKEMAEFESDRSYKVTYKGKTIEVSSFKIGRAPTESNDTR